MQKGKKHVLEIVRHHPEISPSEIVTVTQRSRSMVQKYLRELVDAGYLVKKGDRSQVVYEAVRYASECMQESFLWKDVAGVLFFGIEGFKRWVADGALLGMDFEEQVAVYEKSVKQYLAEKDDVSCFTMDIREKLVNERIFLDALLCRDLYTMQIVGQDTNTMKRTKIAVLLEVVKGSGDRKKLKHLISGYVDAAIDTVYAVIQQKKIDAVAFVPPTAPRPVQIMRLLKKEFASRNVDCIPILSIGRHFPDLHGSRQEQKQIRSVRRRVLNARSTYRVKRTLDQYRRVLLVDDIVGSGATLNEIARQCKEKKIAEAVYGLCLVGINTKKLVVVRKM